MRRIILIKKEIFSEIIERSENSRGLFKKTYNKNRFALLVLIFVHLLGSPYTRRK